MNKKGWTRILIVIVAGLWAYNIYNTIKNHQLKSENKELITSNSLTYAPVLFNKDTFNLFLPSSDPFLKNQKFNSEQINSIPVESNSNRSNPTTRPVVTPVVTKITWPQITYYGFLKKHEENRQLCILNIGGKIYKCSAGESQAGIKIIAAFADSIRLNYKDELKTFPK